MAKSSILTGSRAVLQFIDPSGKAKTVGVFTTANWSVRQEKAPAFILGRYNPAELTPVSQEAVAISLSGFRVVDASVYEIANATALKNLLNEEDFSLQIVDRRSKKVIFRASGCRVTSWSSGVQARSVSDVRLDVIGIIAEDEFNSSDEDSSGAIPAPRLDDGT
jgi:hypothetical protein